jgi:hypothetical protein
MYQPRFIIYFFFRGCGAVPSRGLLSFIVSLLPINLKASFKNCLTMARNETALNRWSNVLGPPGPPGKRARLPGHMLWQHKSKRKDNY